MAADILLIHPTSGNEARLTEHLQNFGYSVHSVSLKSQEFIQHLNSSHHLIIGDFRNSELALQTNSKTHRKLAQTKKPLVVLAGTKKITVTKQLANLSPSLFLFKPINLEILCINLDLIINRQLKKGNKSLNTMIMDSIFIPENFIHHRIRKQNILYIEANGSYSKIRTREGENFQMALNLKHFERQLADPVFLRVSRKHIVNTSHITRINGNKLYLDEIKITISRSKRSDILRQFKILKSK